MSRREEDDPTDGRGQTLDQLLDFYAFMIQANGLIARADDINKLYADICRLGICLDQRLVLAWVGMIAPDSGDVRVLAHAGPAEAYLADLRALELAAGPDGDGQISLALRQGRCVITNRFPDTAGAPPWQARARAFGIQSSAAIPLRREGAVCGALMLYANAPDLFDERIVGELDVLSQTMSYAIDRAAERDARRILDARLQESQQAMRAIFDAAHQTILMMTPEGDILAINRAGAERLGMTPQAMIGGNLFELLPPRVAEFRRGMVAEALRSGTPVMFEDERDNRLFRTNIYPVLEGSPRVVIYAEELSAQRAAERAAREADRQFVEVVNLASEGILTIDFDGRITFANPRLHALLGASKGSLVGEFAPDFIAPEDHADFLTRLKHARSGEHLQALQLRYRLRRRTGEEFPALISAAMKASADGVEDGLVVVITDISELERTQAALAENEQRLEIALAGAAESIWQWNLDTGDAYWSPEFYRQLGYADQAFMSTADAWFEHMHPDDRPLVQDGIQDQLRKQADILETTFRIRNKAGEWRRIRGRGKVVRVAEDGHPVLLTGTNVDVTVQYHEEQLRRRQAERWLSLLQLAKTGEYEGTQGERAFLSRALSEAVRLTDSRIGFVYFVDADQQACELAASTGEGEGGALPSRQRLAIDETGAWGRCFKERRGMIIDDGREAGRSSSVSDDQARGRLIAVPLVRDDRVRAIAWVGGKVEPYDQDDLEFLQILAADVWRIVQRRRAEAELGEVRQVVEASPVVCFRWRAEPGWPVDYVSKNVSRWGWQASDLLAGRPPFTELVHPDDLARVGAEVERNSAAGAVEYVQEYRLRAADAHYFWVEDRTRVVRDEHGIVRFYEGVVTDVDADKRREQDLAAALEQQRALNQKLESAQSQLLQSEKMASIGQLAAGVAHEINNPIGFVSSNFSSLGNYLQDIFEIFDVCDAAAAAASNPADFDMIRAAKDSRDFNYLREDIFQLLNESKEGLERVRKIVQDLKDFSRVGDVEWQWADINRGLDATLNIVWNELKYHCTVTKDYGELPQIYCLPSQLNQVFMNLLVNAGQAIEGKGEIRITTRAVGDDAVQVTISDTGRGIPPENLNRIFDPFFTTKPIGKGTGLGLSLAWSIVRRHGGKFAVDSTVGQGTSFTITLPLKAAESESMETES